MTVTASTRTTNDAAHPPRAAKTRWLVGALFVIVLTLTVAAAFRAAAGDKRTALGRTRTYLLPRAELGFFGINDHATASYVLPIRSGDIVTVTQRDTKGNLIGRKDHFVFRKGPNGWGFKRPVARFAGKGARVRNVAVVCDGPLNWGPSVDPIRQLSLQVPARRVQLGFLARETPHGTVEVR